MGIMKNKIRLLMSAVAVLALSGCLYTNIHTPWAYRAATPAEVKSASGDPTVSGRACNQAVLYLVAWGNSGYRAAVQNALSGMPDSILYDVKTDIHVNSYVLGLYTRTCTVITGKVGHL
jgi:hypothetical protein